MNAYVYDPASGVVLTGELAAQPAAGELIAIRGIEFIVESIRGETSVLHEGRVVDAVKIFARPARCSSCGLRVGSRRFHVKREGRTDALVLCGPCCLRDHPGAHATQSRTHQEAGLPHDDPLTKAIFG